MPRTTRLPRGARLAGVAAAVGACLALSGCGFDVQTLKDYTPANGVNVEQGTLKVRNLMIIANQSGTGRVSASIVSQDKADTLASVTGSAKKADGTTGSALTIGGGGGLALPSGKLVVLTDPATPAITVSGADLKPGLGAKLHLQFGSGVTKDVDVPVVDASDPAVAGVTSATPSSAASASASASTTASASPSATATK